MAEKQSTYDHDKPFFVRQSGLTYGPNKGAIKGYNDREPADADCAERNSRAEELGLKARYEVIAN